MKETPVSVCPVPDEQQPLNEYQQLQESWYFGCCTGPLKRYLKVLIGVWSLSWLIFGPMAASSFPPKKDLGHFLLSGSAGATFIVVLVLLRLYLGWSYIASRLLSPTVVYEESGWYDGQLWHKTTQMLFRDQLLVTHQVQPILRRLKRTFGILGLFLLAGIVSWCML